MKILHVLTTLDVGGAEMHVLKQVRGQAARGHEVRVVYVKGQGTLSKDFLEAGASEVRHVAGGPLFPFKLRRDLSWCDLVHSHLLKADVLTAAAALLNGARRRLISGKHNDEQVLRRALVSRVHGVVGLVPARTIVLSDHVGRFIEEHGRVPRSRQSRIYYGLDPAPFEEAARSVDRAATLAEFGFGPEDVVFICVARFAPQKAHEILLRATAEARAIDPRVKLLLVGDDPFGDGRQRAEAEAARLNLGTSVVFAGIRRDVPALMAASDVFVMASRWRAGPGLPGGDGHLRPVLSTNVSAIPEVVVDGETGRLARRTIHRDGGRDGRSSGDPELSALRRGRSGRVIDRFGLDRMVDDTIAVYRDVTGAS